MKCGNLVDTLERFFLHFVLKKLSCRHSRAILPPFCPQEALLQTLSSDSSSILSSRSSLADAFERFFLHFDFKRLSCGHFRAILPPFCLQEALLWTLPSVIPPFCPQEALLWTLPSDSSSILSSRSSLADTFERFFPHFVLMSYSCRHIWVKYSFKIKKLPPQIQGRELVAIPPWLTEKTVHLKIITVFTEGTYLPTIDVFRTLLEEGFTSHTHRFTPTTGSLLE
ncbi:hypothetical protein JOC76_006027 [Neobacillus cucumis]|nr:hypothetical protein [Neobacillus cucumis]